MMGQLDDIAWGNGKRRRRYTDEQIRAVREDFATQHYTLKQLAKKHSMSDTTVREICNRLRYGDIE